MTKEPQPTPQSTGNRMSERGTLFQKVLSVAERNPWVSSDDVLEELEEMDRQAKAVSPVDQSFQVAPPLNPPRTWKEMEEIAHEDIAQDAATE